MTTEATWNGRGAAAQGSVGAWHFHYNGQQTLCCNDKPDIELESQTAQSSLCQQVPHKASACRANEKATQVAFPAAATSLLALRR